MMDKSFEYSFGCFKGCLGVIVLSILGLVAFGHIEGCVRHVHEKRTDRIVREKEIEDQRIKIRNQEEDLRNFALNQAPQLWHAALKVEVEITNQNARIERLRETLVQFNRLPEEDLDFVKICKKRDGLVEMKDMLKRRLEDAYLAAKKFEAMPDNVEYKQLKDQILTEGVAEAEKAEKFYNQLKQEKENRK